ncbi:Interleukin-1 receptor type 1 [Orchesella cincta]|uniref:Interleukin-1 receptor type 1 n=1 Tax=Orchesella cincta TaxID=48709 RepID=A0A1D2M1Q4_ORCCI|nr:Interleukin-1 receptor type 1 [Orchesella cincta]
MADTKIGNLKYPFVSIYETLNESNQLPTAKWWDIAPRLGVSDEGISAIKNKIMFLNLTPQAIYLEMFRLWSEQDHSETTVGKLVEVLEAVKLSGSANSLRKRFNITEETEN